MPPIHGNITRKSGFIPTIINPAGGGLTNWEAVAKPAAIGFTGLGVNPDNGRIIVGSSDGRMWYTDDAGDNWTQCSLAPFGFGATGTSIPGIAYSSADSCWVAMRPVDSAVSQAYWISVDDGANWTIANTGQALARMQSARYHSAQDQFLVVALGTTAGSGVSSGARSATGAANSFSSTAFNAGTTRWMDSASSAAEIIAGALSGAGSRSTDNGASWGSQSNGVGNLQALTHSADLALFCGVGLTSPFIRTSPSGITWTSRSKPAEVGALVLKGVAAGRGKLVAVGALAGSESVLQAIYSDDGITWHAADTPAVGVGNGFGRVEFNGEYFFAVTPDATGTHFMRSQSGM